MMAQLFIPALIGLSLTAPAVRAEIATKIGPAKALDGDTIRIDGEQISLDGIDAPELRQICFTENKPFACGAQAKRLLEKLFLQGPARCEVLATDSLKRKLGRCSVNGVDLGAHLIERGLAVRYGAGGGRYAFPEQIARKKRRGMWAGRFVLPANWRRGVRTQPYYFDGGGRCLIKGNIQSNGERRYYVPKHPWHHRTRVEGAKGEQWFCTEREAKEAGWKPMPAFPPGSPYRRPDAN